MRVNMDSSIRSDPRFRLIAQDLGITLAEVTGRCFFVWLAAYERRTERLPEVEVDMAAERVGFAAALVARNLASREANASGGNEANASVIMHGVKERIKFLNAQALRGKRGGKASGKARRGAANEANASGTAQAYPPAPDLDLAPDPDSGSSQKKILLVGLPPDVAASKGKKNGQSFAVEIQAVIAYLNEKSGRTFRAAGANAEAVRKRLRAGATVEQCQLVVWFLASKWLGDDRMQEYLRPSTVFVAEKWDERLDDARVAARESRPLVVEEES